MSNRKKWYILILGWLLVAPYVMAKDVAMPSETYFGRRGNGTHAIYNALPYIRYNDESGWMKTDAYANRMFAGTPAISRTDLTTYAIFSGENGNATKTEYHFIPTIQYSLLYIYHAAEVFFGPSGHAAFYVSVTVLDGTDTVGCPYRVGYRMLPDTIGTHYHYLYTDPLTGGRAGYIDWQVSAFDLSRYIGKPLTIVAEATCCSNLSCKSQLSLAFEKASQVIGKCDDSIWVPTYIHHPVWHRGDADGPVISDKQYFVVPDTIGYYTCILDNDCADNIQFLSVPFCPCRDSAEYVQVDTIVPYDSLPVQWHGYTYTAQDNNFMDTILNQYGCDSIIFTYAMQFSHSLYIYSEGCEQPNVWQGLVQGNTVTVYTEPKKDYYFSHWSDGNMDNPRVYTMGEGDMFDTAYFQYKDTFTLTIYSEDCAVPNVFRGLHWGESVTVEPIANPRYSFINWDDGDTNNPRTFTIYGDATYTAQWYDHCQLPMETQHIDTTVCDTLMPYLWHGHLFTQSGETYRDTLRTQQACDSIEYIYRVDTVNCPPPTCVDSLVFRKWKDVLFCDNTDLQFVAYQWYRNNQALTGETGQYLVIDNDAESATYFVIVTRKDGSTLFTCPYTFYEYSPSASTYGRITAISGRKGWLRVTVPDDEVRLTIWNIVGEIIHETTIHNQVELYLPTMGTYIFSLKGPQRESIHKIINY